jgi:hypothetical protein
MVYFRQRNFVRARSHSLDPGLTCQHYWRSIHSNTPLPNVDKRAYGAFFSGTNNIVDIPGVPVTTAKHQYFVVLSHW